MKDVTITDHVSSDIWVNRIPGWGGAEEGSLNASPSHGAGRVVCRVRWFSCTSVDHRRRVLFHMHLLWAEKQM